MEFCICIDRAVSAPGHGRDLVDGLNAVDKTYLRQMMCMIGVPEANDGEKRMAAHAMAERASGGERKLEKASLAVECQRLLSDGARAHGVKGVSDQKRQAAAKMKERKYAVWWVCVRVSTTGCSRTTTSAPTRTWG